MGVKYREIELDLNWNLPPRLLMLEDTLLAALETRHHETPMYYNTNLPTEAVYCSNSDTTICRLIGHTLISRPSRQEEIHH